MHLLDFFFAMLQCLRSFEIRWYVFFCKHCVDLALTSKDRQSYHSVQSHNSVTLTFDVRINAYQGLAMWTIM